MEFKKYQHVSRLGVSGTDGILNGECFIFPKIDGTNSQVYLNKEGELCGGSRNRELGLGKSDNQGFYGAMLKQENIINYLKEHPTHRLFGEWLVPHSLKTYKDDAWRKFYVFDVCIDDGDGLNYLAYPEYSKLLDKFGIEYLKPLAICTKPTLDEIKDIVNSNTHLIKEGHGCGEGIVIKRYDFVNKYGEVLWAKVLHDEYNNSNSKAKVKDLTDGELENIIVEQFVTSDFINKEYAKILNDEPEINKKVLIPKLLGTTYKVFIEEEIFNICKKFKNPKIDFRLLHKSVMNKIKEVKVELFV